MTYILNWLASPFRVLAMFCRLMSLTALLGGPAASVYYHGSMWAGLAITAFLGIPLWAMFTVALYGPKVMIDGPVDRKWLWRHVTAMWETPER